MAKRRFLGAALGIAILAGQSHASDWLQFRGSDCTGKAANDAIPTSFDAAKKTNIAWKTPLPGRGLSSPIVVGDRVFVSACDGRTQDQLQVLAFDAKTGKKLWQRTIWGTGPTEAHPVTNMAAPTPASDGKYLVTLFATNDVLCLDLDGNVKWIRSLYEENPGATDGRGLASSPIIVDGVAAIIVENQNTSFAAGIDVATGVNLWRVDRPKQLNWSTPISIHDKEGKAMIMLQGEKLLTVHEPRTGKEVWRMEKSFDPVASSVLTARTLLIPGEDGLSAYELCDSGPPKLLWTNNQLGPQTSSPVVVDDRVYCSRGTFLVSANLKDGKGVGKIRLAGAFSSSLVAANGHVYLFNEEGVGHVIKADAKQGTVVSKSPLKDKIQCTPAIANGAMYVRSDKFLYKIANN